MSRNPIIPESKIHIQENTQWCYAAVIQMISRSLNFLKSINVDSCIYLNYC